MRCCQNKTSFSWSYRDLSKRSLENNVISRRRREKYTRFEIGGHVQMAKSDPEAQRKSSLSDCTWLENQFGSFSLETLKFLMHFWEPGSSLYFIHNHFFFFSHFLYSLFKDTNKKTNVYAIIKISVSQIERYTTLGFELPIPSNDARKRACWRFKTVLKFTTSLRVT
jgi:hypothetical protein